MRVTPTHRARSLVLMADDYQRGSDIEWLKHSNEELGRIAQKRARQAQRWQLIALLLLLVIGWLVYRYSQKAPVRELWQLPPEVKKLLPAR
jgi:hypothetical protein